MGGGQVGGLNILTKKRWHVRTRENIERVRRDEAAAAEEERKRKERADLAEKEARTDYLRQKAAARRREAGIDYQEPGPSTSKRPRSDTHQEEAGTSGNGNGTTRHEHVNLFADFETSAGVNPDTVKEKAADRDKYHKSIGALVYLGQGSAQRAESKPWYEELPDRSKAKVSAKGGKGSVDVTSKGKSLVSSSGQSKKVSKKRTKPSKSKRSSKRKRRSSSSSSSSSSTSSASSAEWVESKASKPATSYANNKVQEQHDSKSIEHLRAERLKRENMERDKTAALLAKINGTVDSKSSRSNVEVREAKKPVQKYNSQYFPGICKQNKMR